MSIQTFIDITVQPVSINTTLNSTVIFTCVANATDLIFKVNDILASDEAVKRKGFVESTDNSGRFINGTLRAIAYDSNNNTNITCKASNDVPAVNYSKPALLLIQG